LPLSAVAVPHLSAGWRGTELRPGRVRASPPSFHHGRPTSRRREGSFAWGALSVSRCLDIVQLGVMATFRHQAVVSPHFGDTRAVQHDDQIGHADG
jgi:hypothetical protein